jgi:hypothetical protein
VKKRRIIAGMLAASLALVGVLAYLVSDGGGAGGSKGWTEKAGSRKRGDTAAGFGDTTFADGVDGSGGGAALTPAQEATIRAALEKLGNEAALRTAFTAGVAEPWPLAQAQTHFERCITTVERGLPVESTQVPADICACAIRAFQGVYPREPPVITSAKVNRVVGEDMRRAVDECMNP